MSETDERDRPGVYCTVVYEGVASIHSRARLRTDYSIFPVYASSSTARVRPYGACRVRARPPCC